MKCCSETLKNLLYFKYKKTRAVFFPYKCPDLTYVCNHKGKNKARIMRLVKNKNNISIMIGI